jgi:hypothetical protein
MLSLSPRSSAERLARDGQRLTSGRYPLYNAFLPYIQASRGADFGDGSTSLTYRNSLIIAAVGVPGALVGGLLVEQPRFGRKGTLALSTTLTGVFLYGSTTALTSRSLLGWNCAFSFASNVMYAVLYGFTPELFPTPQRGTGNALTATCNRIFGIMAVQAFPFFRRLVIGMDVDETDHMTAYCCHVCQSGDGGSGVHQRCAVHRCRGIGLVIALRVAREGRFVNGRSWLGASRGRSAGMDESFILVACATGGY